MLATAALGCVDGAPDVGVRADPVIGGTVTAEGLFPGVGALLYDVGDPAGPAAQCTGTLIAPTVVLTAAHCIDPQLTGPGPVGFTLVHDTKSAPPAMVAVERVVEHEQFDLQSNPGPGLNHWFDVGLVFLAAPITDVEPILLPRPTDAPDLVADTDLTIVGYGRTSNATQEVGVMYDAATKLVSLNDWELQVGMGRGQPQNCHGDSGGPALAELDGTRVVGVVSRSFDGSAQCLNGGLDTRVDAYLDWIFAQDPPDIACGSGLAPACDDGGCCSTSGAAPTGSLALAGVALMSLRRRRRR